MFNKILIANRGEIAVRIIRVSGIAVVFFATYKDRSAISAAWSPIRSISETIFNAADISLKSLATGC